MINGEIHLRLTDFGEVSEIDKKEEFLKGTQLYQSPEMVLERDDQYFKMLTPKVDIWAIGLVFLYILTHGTKLGYEKWLKETDFDIYETQERLIKSGKEGLEFSADEEGYVPKGKNFNFYNEAYKKIVNECLIFNPEKRITSVKIIENAEEIKKDLKFSK